MSSHHTTQIVIVGAGPAGCTTAAALAADGIDVLLVDRATFPRDKVCGDGLTPRSVAVIKALGLLPQLEASGAKRISGLQITGPEGRSIRVNFDELASDIPSFGLTVPRRALDSALLQKAMGAGARFLDRFRVRRLNQRDGRVVGVQGQHKGQAAEIDAPLTCLAVGAAMTLSLQAGLLDRAPPIIRAARGYFSSSGDLEPVFQFHFDQQLLPGYGWLFPMSGGRVNVGAGFFPDGRFKRDRSAPHRAVERFVLRNARVQAQLNGLAPVGPIKSHPLRTDFGHYPCYKSGLLLVGEAAGLVNPITGEGVDYALESGLLAAQVAAAALARDSTADEHLSRYDALLRDRYQALFFYLTRMRRWYVRRHILSLILRKAPRRPRLRHLFANAALGLIDPREGVSLRTLADILA